MTTQGVFINGAGVLGRQLIRWIIENSDVYNSENFSSIVSLKIKGINDANMTGAQLAYLLTYDTVYGKLKGHTVDYDSDTGKFTIDGNSTLAFPFTNIANVDDFEQGYLGNLNAPIVFDCMGISANTTKEYGLKYEGLGAQIIYLCSDRRGDTDIVGAIFGVNTDTIYNIGTGSRWIPSGIGTAVAIMSQLVDNFAGINSAFAHIVTSYTNLNNLQDSAAVYINRPMQADRGGAVNIIPYNTTKAGSSVGLFVAGLNGKVFSFEASAGVNAGATVNLIAFLKDTSADISDFINVINTSQSLDSAYNSDNPFLSYEKINIVSSDKIGDLDVTFTLTYDTQIVDKDANMVNITSMFDPIMVQLANMILTCAYDIRQHLS